MEIKMEICETLRNLVGRRTDLTPWYMFYDKRLERSKIMEITTTKDCKECGHTNSVNRLTCANCHEPFFKKVKKAMPEEVKAKLKATSKERNGKKRKVEKRVKEILEKPKNPTPKIGDPKPAAKARTCPCCGEETNRGTYFRIGHDARIKGMFIKKSKSKDNLPTLTERLSKLYEAWTPEKSIKEIVKMVEG